MRFHKNTMVTVPLKYHYQKLKGRAKPRLPNGSPIYGHYVGQVSKCFDWPFLRNRNLNFSTKIIK